MADRGWKTSFHLNKCYFQGLCLFTRGYVSKFIIFISNDTYNILFDITGPLELYTYNIKLIRYLKKNEHMKYEM